MAWPRDDAKLERVRALMAEQELDTLVVRAPDNVLYLTNFWGMKGYDAVVFPREGEPVLICLEASAEDAERMAWTKDVRLFAGYDPADPRPPGAARARARARRRRGPRRARALARHAGDRPDGRRADHLPEGLVRRLARRSRCGAAPRPGASDQDRAGGRADAPRERDRRCGDGARPGRPPAGDDLRAGGGRVAGLRPRRGHRLEGPGRARAPLLARLVGIEHQDLHGDHGRPSRRGRADALRDLGLRRRLLGRPHEEPVRRRALPALRGARSTG